MPLRSTHEKTPETADTIKLGMISLAEAENVYGASILFRSLIEHYIRFHHLPFRFLEIWRKGDALVFTRDGSVGVKVVGVIGAHRWGDLIHDEINAAR